MGTITGIEINIVVTLLLCLLLKLYRKSLKTERIVNFWSWIMSFASHEQELEFYQSYTRKRLELVIENILFLIILISAGILFIQTIMLKAV